MSGGETSDAPSTGIAEEHRGPPSESEEIRHRLENGNEGDGEEDVDEEGFKARGKGESKVEAVADKVGKKSS